MGVYYYDPYRFMHCSALVDYYDFQMQRYWNNRLPKELWDEDAENGVSAMEHEIETSDANQYELWMADAIACFEREEIEEEELRYCIRESESPYFYDGHIPDDDEDALFSTQVNEYQGNATEMINSRSTTIT